MWKRNLACVSVVVNDHFLLNSLLVHWIKFFLAVIFQYTRFEYLFPRTPPQEKVIGWVVYNFLAGLIYWDWLIKCCVKKLLYTLTSCTISNLIATHVCYNRRNTAYNHSHKNFDKRQELAFFISDKLQVSSISSPNSRKRIISRSLIFATDVQ